MVQAMSEQKRAYRRYTPGNPPKRGLPKSLWMGLEAIGFGVMELVYVRRPGALFPGHWKVRLHVDECILPQMACGLNREMGLYISLPPSYERRIYFPRAIWQAFPTPWRAKGD